MNRFVMHPTLSILWLRCVGRSRCWVSSGVCRRRLLSTSSDSSHHNSATSTTTISHLQATQKRSSRKKFVLHLRFYLVFGLLYIFVIAECEQYFLYNIIDFFDSFSWNNLYRSETFSRFSTFSNTKNPRYQFSNTPS